MRTTLDLDPTVLSELKASARKEHKTAGTLASELLAVALRDKAAQKKQKPEFKWLSSDMGAKVDLEDKDALFEVLDRK